MTVRSRDRRRPVRSVTSQCSAAGRAATPPPSAPPSSERRRSASTRRSALGGTCLRIGCIPTKAGCRPRSRSRRPRRPSAKLGVKVGEPEPDFAAANAWKGAVVKQLTSGVASPSRRRGRMGPGRGPLLRSQHHLGAGQGGRSLQAGDHCHRVVSAAAADSGDRLEPCVDSAGLLRRSRCPGDW